MGPNLVTGVLGGRGEATEERGGYGGVEAELGGRCRGPGTQAQRAGPSRGLSVAPPPESARGCPLGTCVLTSLLVGAPATRPHMPPSLRRSAHIEMPARGEVPEDVAQPV